MTASDAFDEGRLTEALALQEVCAGNGDAAERLLLVQLLLIAGRLEEARTQLALIESDEPGWPGLARSIVRLARAEERRVSGRRPAVPLESIPSHLKRRWTAWKRLRESAPLEAVQLIDFADERTPEVRGFLDGQEFDRLRDADDRFASVLELCIGSRYAWLPWEALRSVRLEPARTIRDRQFRPATVRLADGTAFEAHLPLIYPDSFRAEGAFACGLDTDFIGSPDSPLQCVGRKLLLVGDDAEVPLASVRMLELRPV